AQVWAVDVNERARELTEKNLLANGLANVTVAAPDDVPPDLEFDAIFSNPPIRIGKAAMQEMLDRWLRRLTPSLVLEDPDLEDPHEGGRAYLVVQKHLGADSLHDWLRRRGYLTERIASSKGYRVFVVEGKVAEG
ncbi:MAG: methyltransferase, partial [Acidimicrobiia bacterium]